MAELAGRTVAIAADVPAGFDGPLAEHHKMIGRWIVARDPGEQMMITRAEARRYIEAAFGRVVQQAMAAVSLAELRVVVLQSEDALPPAIAIVCDSIGQVDLGWIEKTNVLRHTLNGSVAPVGWRAAAYAALAGMLSIALPCFGFDDMMQELSGYYWDGEIDDEEARRSLIEYHGHDPDDVILPSQVVAKRPDFMLAENVAPLKAMPPALRQRMRKLAATYDALKAFGDDGCAWHFDFEEVTTYLPEYEDASCLPPMTIVPVDEFGQEVDEIGRMGMETRFLDVAGICPLADTGAVERWFVSLCLGADFLTAAQDLIAFDPTADRRYV